MCGIAGIIASAELDPRALALMSSALEHRGPDGEGFLVTDLSAPLVRTRQPAAAPPGRPVVGFAHRRLSIIDLSADNDQPLVDAAGGLAIAFNGEIYNYRELRQELEGLGHRFHTSGDTEVALISYAEWGPDCVERFVGMWALAICDRARRQLVLTRDRFGIKPLYWTLDTQRLLFASEIKGLLASGLVTARPDETTVARYLVGGQVDVDEKTFYAGIHQFPAASTAVISLDDPRLHCRPTPYWSLPEAPAEAGCIDGLDAVARDIRGAFEDSLRLHLRSDVPVGTCLSGGIDSSGIVCVASRLRDDVGPTYTHKGFGYLPIEQEFSEQPYMDAVARQCGLEMTYVQPSETDFHQALTAVVAAQDEPFGSASVAAQWFIFEAAGRGGVKVMLDGQGADEVFGGYHHYLRLIAQDLLIRGRRREFVRFMRNVAGAVGEAPYPPWLSLAAILPGAVKRRARAALIARAAARAPVSERLRRIADDGAADPLPKLDVDSILRADVASNLPALLRYEDRNSMAHSIEARVPYLDHRLVEAAFAVPACIRMAGGQPKRVLREALRDALPATVLERRDKIGFRASPSATWSLARKMRTDLGPGRDGPGADWLSPVRTARLLERSSLRMEDEFMLWRALNATLWARRAWG